MPTGGDFADNYCGVYSEHPQIKQCTDAHLNYKTFTEAFAKECEGKTSCKLNFNNHLDRAKAKGPANKCTDFFARVYVNYSCQFETVVQENQKIAWLVATLGVVSCLIFTYTIWYLRRSAQLNFKRWDIETVTSADFTIQVNFSKNLWSNWKEKSQKEAYGNRSLKEFIKREMCEQLQNRSAAL